MEDKEQQILKKLSEYSHGIINTSIVDLIGYFSGFETIDEFKDTMNFLRKNGYLNFIDHADYTIYQNLEITQYGLDYLSE